jgi:hypothetical protein
MSSSTSTTIPGATVYSHRTRQTARIVLSVLLAVAVLGSVMGIA